MRQALPTLQTKECFLPQRFYHNLGTGLNPLFVAIRSASELESDVLGGDHILPGLELRAHTLDLSAELPPRKEPLHQRSVVVVTGFGYGGMLNYLQNPEPSSHLAHGAVSPCDL